MSISENLAKMTCNVAVSTEAIAKQLSSYGFTIESASVQNIKIDKDNYDVIAYMSFRVQKHPDHALPHTTYQLLIDTIVKLNGKIVSHRIGFIDDNGTFNSEIAIGLMKHNRV